MLEVTNPIIRSFFAIKNYAISTAFLKIYFFQNHIIRYSQKLNSLRYPKIINFGSHKKLYLWIKVYINRLFNFKAEKLIL